MPSDERATRPPEFPAALQPARDSFRTAVTAAAEHVRGLLATHEAPATGAGQRTARELGPFAAGRIDSARFAALFAGAETLDPRALERLERAHAVLAEVAAAGDELYSASVPAGGDLRATALRALAHAGRAFGAARVVELVRGGRFVAEEHDRYLEAFPPALWTRPERLLAPPLALEVGGAELQAGALADLLQGVQKIVLQVHAPAPPAPLVRLVTPGTFVLQATDAAALAALGPVPGPAVAALLPAGAAAFVHDPAAGATLPMRLSVGELPVEAPKAAIGSYSVAQQAEELEQLTALSHLTATALPSANGASAEGVATIADRLAAWLLHQGSQSAAQG